MLLPKIQYKSLCIVLVTFAVTSIVGMIFIFLFIHGRNYTQEILTEEDIEYKALKDRIKHRNFYKISDDGDVDEDVETANIQDNIYIDEEYNNNPKIDFDIRSIEYFDQIISDRMKALRTTVQDDDTETIQMQAAAAVSATTTATTEISGQSNRFLTTDDDSISSGSGDYGFERSLKINRDNVYSVSSEIILTNLMPKNKAIPKITVQSPREPHMRTRSNPPRDNGAHKDGMWLETRTRRIMGNARKSVERSKQLLLCEEVGSGELCRILFKGDIND